jgi:hypothetical protein
MPSQVFLSYAQVPEGHRQRVAELADALRAAGLSVVFDHDVTSPQGPPEGWPKWMLDQIEQADWVLVVCNEAYYRRFRGREVPGIGLGASWEGAVIGQALYSDGTRNRKFIPVLFGDEPAAYIPEPLRGATCYRLPAEISKLTAALLGGSPGERPAVASPVRPPAFGAVARWRIALLILLGALGLAGWRLWKAEPRPGAPAANFPLTVYVHGPDGPQDLVLRGKGAVLLLLGSDHRREPIQEKGQANFQEIPASFRGQPVNLALDADGYELADSRPRTLNGASLDLTVRRKPGHLAGRVQDGEGHPVAKARIEVADLSTKTDDSGRFDLVIPADHVQRGLVVQVVAAGYQPYSLRAEIGSNDVSVNLTPSH